MNNVFFYFYVWELLGLVWPTVRNQSRDLWSERGQFFLDLSLISTTDNFKPRSVPVSRNEAEIYLDRNVYISKKY